MHRGGSVDSSWRASLAEIVKLFVLPPLVTFALVASTLLLFSTYLAERSLRTTYVVEPAPSVVGAGLDRDRDTSCSPLAARPHP